MVAISLMVEGQIGLTWQRWQRLIEAVDGQGFAGLFRSDHFTNPNPPDYESLELVVSLTYLAAQSKHIHFGPLVAPVSFRDPVMLTRQAAALSDLSGGRMILGMGSGWQDREHHAYGYPLGDIPTRMARFEEGLEVATRLLHSEGPATFEGRFYQLHDAQLLPRPQQKLPLLIGGNGPKRLLPLVARYADIWNAVFLRPDEFRERSTLLDTLLQKEGRQPADVKRTAMQGIYFGKDSATLDRKLEWRHSVPELKDKSLDAVVHTLHTEKGNIVGTAEQVIQQIKAYEEAGVEELMVQWLDIDDIEGIQAFATEVLPHCTK
uniref:LLM class F420-dependent oxidoreductase n=1 Tax=Thermosporothrix sp. COM3 TaxID=2490863 RepID=A0A455SJB0_9CHLR|nr:LLM class F420-dependent oxidoreductase [Thermosporothrix sp. COM3]